LEPRDPRKEPSPSLSRQNNSLFQGGLAKA
jgi:hypothetical protein